MPTTSQKPIIVIDDAVPYAQAMFSHLGDVKLIPGRNIRAQDVKQAKALIVRSRTQVNAELLADSTVNFVGSTVVGLDHIDQDFLAQSAIQFYSAQGCNANSVAQYIIHVLVELAEQQGFQLQDKTLGIVGVGQVGRRLAHYAQCLGIQCLLNDPPRAQAEGLKGFCDLDTLIEQADIISLHTPLTLDGDHPTRHLINAQRLQQLKPDSIVINAARGGIIDEAAWCRTSNHTKILDCWQDEPKINAQLYQQAQLATPHIAGHSLDAKINGSEMVYHALCAAWHAQPETQWKQHLPTPPKPLTLPDANKTSSPQARLHNVLNQVYQPWQDDQALRHETIQQVHQAFEHYRRHYPIHREWPQHQVRYSDDQQLNRWLKCLGFVLY